MNRTLVDIEVMTVREVLKRMRRDGWVVVRQRRSHRQLHHPTKPGTVTVAGKPKRDMDPKTLASIWRQAGLTGEETE
jgi:predicted RNA binding protein YcfA (HicA-like mRNA interferase family)